MKVELTKKAKALLQDPEATRQLHKALVDRNEGEIHVGETRYKLVSLTAAEVEGPASR